MTIGEKIRYHRLQKGMTQQSLAGAEISRNMVSMIENGEATPSLSALFHLAKALSLPPAYLLSETEDLYFYRKAEQLPRIHALFRQERFSECAALIESLGEPDDEMAYLAAYCYAGAGKKLVLLGSMASGGEALERGLGFCEKTLYDTRIPRAVMSLYLAVAQNVSAPLLEWDPATYEDTVRETADYDFFKYVCQDAEYPFRDERYRLHLEAKALLRKYRYEAALVPLSQLEETKNSSYNAPLLYGVYADTEQCYKQLNQYESAYRYCSKRLALLENFKG